MHHVTKLKSSQTGFFHFTQMASTVTRSQSNRAPLGCGGTGDSHHGCAAENLQQLCDAIMSIWTKISEECLQHLVESMPRRIKAVLKAKGVQPGTSKVYLKKLPVSVCVCMYACIYIYTHTHCFPHDFVRLVAAGDVTLICIFITSFRKVCVQTSFGTSDLFYSMNCHILQYNWMPNKAVHIIFSVVIHKSINKLIINLWMSWRIPSVSLLVKWWLLLKY